MKVFVHMLEGQARAGAQSKYVGAKKGWIRAARVVK